MSRQTVTRLPGVAQLLDFAGSWSHAAAVSSTIHVATQHAVAGQSGDANRVTTPDRRSRGGDDRLTADRQVGHDSAPAGSDLRLATASPGALA